MVVCIIPLFPPLRPFLDPTRKHGQAIESAQPRWTDRHVVGGGYAYWPPSSGGDPLRRAPEQYSPELPCFPEAHQARQVWVGWNGDDISVYVHGSAPAAESSIVSHDGHFRPWTGARARGPAEEGGGGGGGGGGGNGGGAFARASASLIGGHGGRFAVTGLVGGRQTRGPQNSDVDLGTRRRLRLWQVCRPLLAANRRFWSYC